MTYRIVRQNLPNYLKEGAVIVDVRTPEEFRNGNVRGSVNIPLLDLHANSDKLDPDKTILLCCRSGSRSGMAAGILKGKGFKNVVNAGPWNNLA
ncbi:MAG: rhodanese-like domain-containing protein [Nitrospinae bacterium]|nr:rhodanese-like domain-containing protein [Nitrospinota bacterium]